MVNISYTGLYTKVASGQTSHNTTILEVKQSYVTAYCVIA